MKLVRHFFFAVLIAMSPACRAQAEPSAPPSLQRAAILAEAGRYEDALSVLRQLDDAELADSFQLNQLLGSIYLAIDRPARALEFLNEADLHAADDAGLLVKRAHAHLKLGQLDDARKLAMAALRADSEPSEPELVLALIAFRSGDGKAARERMSRLLARDPDSAAATVAQAKFLVATGDTAAALKLLDTHTRRAETAAEVLDYAGELQFRLGDKPLGIKMRRRAAILFAEHGDQYRSDVAMAWLASHEPMAPSTPDASVKPAPQGEPERERVTSKADPKPTGKPGAKPAPKREPLPTQEALPAIQRFPFPSGVTITGGSGFVVDAGRKVVTNRHVIDGGKEVAVRTGLGEVISARVIYTSTSDDIAILELERPLAPERAIPDDAYAKPDTGRQVVVMGYPLWYILGEGSPSLTNGMVSKASGMRDDKATFQLTAKINKGNSGGPVFDLYGNVVGITVGKLDTKKISQEEGFVPEDVNFAIHVDRLPAIANTQRRTAAVNEAPLSPEALYKLMLGRVVMVATYK